MSEGKDKWSIVQNKRDLGKETSPTPSEDIMSEGNNSEYSFQIYEESDILSSTSGENNSDFESLLGQGEMNHMNALLNSGPSLGQSNLFNVDINGNNNFEDTGFQSNATLRDVQIEQLSNSMAVQRATTNGKRTLENDDYDSNSGSKTIQLDNEQTKKLIEQDIIQPSHQRYEDTNTSGTDVKKEKARKKKAQRRKNKKAKLALQNKEDQDKTTQITKNKEEQEAARKHNITTKNSNTMGKCTKSESNLSSCHQTKGITFPSSVSNGNNNDTTSLHSKQSCQKGNKPGNDVPINAEILTKGQIFSLVILTFLFVLGAWKFISLLITFINLFRNNTFSTFSGREVAKFGWNFEPNDITRQSKNFLIDSDTGIEKTHSFESSLYISTTSSKDNSKIVMEFWKPQGKYLIDFDTEEIYKLDITGMMLNWYEDLVKESKNQYDQFKSMVEKEINPTSERIVAIKELFERIKIRASCNAHIINNKAKSWFAKYQTKLFHI